MKCYYCETEFTGNVCPKCMAVYTITSEEIEKEYKIEAFERDTSSQMNEEEIKATVKVNREEDKEKKGKGKKSEIIFDVVEAIADVVGSFFD